MYLIRDVQTASITSNTNIRNSELIDIHKQLKNEIQVLETEYFINILHVNVLIMKLIIK
jgi:hypothetical protein